MDYKSNYKYKNIKVLEILKRIFCIYNKKIEHLDIYWLSSQCFFSVRNSPNVSLSGRGCRPLVYGYDPPYLLRRYSKLIFVKKVTIYSYLHNHYLSVLKDAT